MKNMIPYQIRASLLQMEPSLDLNWQELLQQIFAQCETNIQEEINLQILIPKEIIWNRVNHTFEYKETNSLVVLKHSLTSERMRSIAAKLSQSIQWLENIEDSVQIADFLENTLHQIDLIPVEDNLKLQREKLFMRRVYLQDVAKIIRNIEIKPLKGLRQLDAIQIKSFIIEVYIKQQLLGYWFKPLLDCSSAVIKYPLFKKWLLKKQAVRRFDIVKTSEYLFVIAPVNNFELNPYSIRRFLFENFIENSQKNYLNGVVLDMRRYNDQGYLKNFMHQIEKMEITQHPMYKDVIQIVQEFEDVSEKIIIPLLKKSLVLAGVNSDLVAKKHIKNFEDILVNQFLDPLKDALRSNVSQIEEYQYLYTNIHRIFSNILAHYIEFKTQPALFLNKRVQLFEYKLLAYLKLLEKRKDEIFVPLSECEWSVMDERAKKPIFKLQQDISNHIQDDCEVKGSLTLLEKDKIEFQNSFIKRIVSGDKLDEKIQQAAITELQIRRQAHLDILAIPKNYRKYSVFVEYESLTATNELERHYALPRGDNGITRLPLLIKLSESFENFSLDNLNSNNGIDFSSTASLV